MAKVKFSALVSEMRNKLNGSVFARNRGGAYLRTKVTPTNPQSIAQVQARSLLTQFSQGWRSLTQAERDAWNSVVDQWATTDVFGDIVNPTGSTLYTRLNINISNAGGTAITSPPTPTGADALANLTLTADSAAPEVVITTLPGTVPAGHALYVEATAQLSPGISNAKSKFRTIASINPATVGPFDVISEYTAKFGALVAGQKMFVRCKLINRATGEVSQSLVASAIVA